MRTNPNDWPHVGGFVVVWLVIAVVAGMGFLALVDPGSIDVLVTAELQRIRRFAEGRPVPADQPGHQPMHLPGRLAGKPGSSSGSGVRVLGVPVAPAGIGLILGPLVEVHFRRALSISQSDWTVLFTDRSRLPC